MAGKEMMSSPLRPKTTVKNFCLVSMLLLVVYHSGFRRPDILYQAPLAPASEARLGNATDKLSLSNNDGSFEAENLASKKRVPCGKEKCFFRHKSDANIGFLVSRAQPNRQDRQDRFGTLVAGWELAKSLEKDSNISHFLSAPPMTIKVTDNDLVRSLNRNLWSEKHEKKRHSDKLRYPKNSIAYIQRVQVAPKQTLLIGCATSKLEPFKKHVDEFLGTVANPKAFVQHFKTSFDTTRKVLDAEPCLIKDFQVLLDSTGTVHHLDFDRCFMPEDSSVKYTVAANETASCLNVLDTIEHDMQERLVHR